jgi:hypothetical protein
MIKYESMNANTSENQYNFTIQDGQSKNIFNKFLIKLINKTKLIIQILDSNLQIYKYS